MNYEYGEPFLEIKFRKGKGKTAKIKKSLITDIYEYVNDSRETIVEVGYMQGSQFRSYRFFGTMEEFEKNSKTVFI